jgi:hypothetical protein
MIRFCDPQLTAAPPLLSFTFCEEEGTGMDYELARASVLLRDLAHIGRGRAPGVQLVRADDGGVPIRGTATRIGLLRLAVRLGQAALVDPTVVVIHEGGFVSDNTAAADGLVQVVLADDPPAAPVQPSVWLPRLLSVFWLVIAALCMIGLATVVQWLTQP